jgi:molecular chaperone GrpE (heat shock protein)
MSTETSGLQSDTSSAQRTWNQEQKRLSAIDSRPEPGTAKPALASAEDKPEEEAGDAEEPTVEDALLFIANHCAEIHDNVTALLNQSAEAAAADFRRENFIDKLHQENQRLRAGEIREAVEPVLRDLIRLHDDLEKSARAWAAKGVCESGAAAEFGIFADVAADTLARYGVEKFTVEPGSPFQIQEHRALAALPTTSREQDRRIHQVVHAGFRCGPRILRSLEVEVYLYPERKAETAQSHQ